VTAALVWFRQDLRLSDNPAFAAALERGPAIPVFIWAPEEEGAWPPGAASRWWLHHSLQALGRDLEARGSRLIIRRGPTSRSLEKLAAETGAGAVYWNRRYEPAALARDAMVKTALRGRGLAAESFNANLLFEPWTIRNASGGPYRVFTPFWRACVAQRVAPLGPVAPRRLAAPESWPESLELRELNLRPAVDWAVGLRESWQPGEEGARRRMGRFLESSLDGYAEGRDRLGETGTSRLSPHLHFGEISPAALWRAIESCGKVKAAVRESYLRQLAWREFAYHLLFHFPETAEQPLRPAYAAFPWRFRRDWFHAWKRGQTGYPLVDAGMRELWRTGWMHNRARMAVASFLVKHLLISWRDGAAWFWDTLVDADLANNTLGWQWVAGCGADAAPYFRIFNPRLQAAKYDPDNRYIARWAPDAGGEGYPREIVNHAEARARALDALASISK
jgi:deoxyribodipyrimidine photo-lyase